MQAGANKGDNVKRKGAEDKVSSEARKAFSMAERIETKAEEVTSLN